MGSFKEPRLCPLCDYKTKDSGNLKRHVQNCTKTPEASDRASVEDRNNDTTLISPELKHEQNKVEDTAKDPDFNTNARVVPPPRMHREMPQKLTSRKPHRLHSKENTQENPAVRPHKRTSAQRSPPSEAFASSLGNHVPIAEYRVTQPRIPLLHHAPGPSPEMPRPPHFYAHPSPVYDSSQASTEAVMMQILHSLLKVEHRLDRIEAQLALI